MSRRPGRPGRPRIDFVGLQGTITDVLARLAARDGGHSTTLVRASRPWVEDAGASGPRAVAAAYVAHGMEHILLGYDHLLFVSGAHADRSRTCGRSSTTITAFTLAHSITLAPATLGVVHVPGPPVEARSRSASCCSHARSSGSAAVSRA